MNKPITKAPAEIRCDIEEELCEFAGLTADINSIREMGLLLGTNDTCNAVRVGHIFEALADQAQSRIDNINALVKQLGAS